MEDMLRVGVIASTHGLKGEVKVFPTTDDINRFKKLKEAIIKAKVGDITVHVEQCKFFKNMAILKFKEFDSINEIQGFVKADLMVERGNAVPLGEDEYFICDIIGASVYEEGKEEQIGTLTDVLQTGANDVYIVRMEDGREVLFPVIPDCVKTIDIENKKVVINIMDGLME